MLAQDLCASRKTLVHGSGARLTDSVATLDSAVITAIAQAVTVAMQATQTGGWNRADHKALGGPPEWDSAKNEKGFVEWHIKVKA